MSIEYIWSGLALLNTDHSARAGAAAAVRDYGPKTNAFWIYLARDRRLLEKFGWGLCWFGIFGSVLTLVEDVDAPIEVPGVYIPCVYKWIQ